MKSRWPLLPHEMAFGVYFVLMWARLLPVQGFFGHDTLVYFGFIALNVILIVRCLGEETDFNWRLRLMFYPLAMNVFYAVSRTAVPAVHPQLEDAALQMVDHALIGGNLSLRLEPFVNPVLTEVMSCCYALFMPYLFVSMVIYFLGDLQVLKRFCSGLFTIYGIGLIGYSLVPALGPYLAMDDQFHKALTGGWVTQFSDWIVMRGSNRVDVFPSLHCGVTSFLLFFDRTHRPTRFKWWLIPCIVLWVSTIYLRYHYFIDLICGFGLTATVFWLVNLYERATYEIPAHV